MNWEYKVIDTSKVERESFTKGWTRDTDKVEAFLNQLGDEGWEIFSVDYNHESLMGSEVGTFYALAKRPKT